ncbi:NINE protein [Paenarthrobacter sp. CCNWLY172]|uniref:NINE protein n=1 Tax=unclassified Paenarthrobacter TaxID=2634190 RepID=UPI000B61E2C0|nr:hypothetical protein CGK93_04120 [Arthrobacter sp. YN]
MARPGRLAVNRKSANFPCQWSRQSFLTPCLLALLLGDLGVGRFYFGKFGTGIAKLLTRHAAYLGDSSSGASVKAARFVSPS